MVLSSQTGIRTRLLAPVDLCWAQLITAVGQTRYILMAAHGTTWSTDEVLSLRESGWTSKVSFFLSICGTPFFILHERPFFAEAKAACRVCILSGGITITMGWFPIHFNSIFIHVQVQCSFLFKFQTITLHHFLPVAYRQIIGSDKLVKVHRITI